MRRLRGFFWFRGIRVLREMRSIRGLRANWAEGAEEAIWPERAMKAEGA